MHEVFDYGEKIFLSAHRDDDNEKEERVNKTVAKIVSIFLFILYTYVL